MNLYDAHQHFHFDPLTPHRAAIDADLRRLGVKRAVVNATNEEEWPVVAALAREYDWILPSFGIHPWDCGNRSPHWLAGLRAQLVANPRAAVGEIGLDRWIIDGLKPDDPRLAGLRVAPLAEQSEVFAAQLALATELDRAASIHCVQAWGALLGLLKKNARPARGFLLHGYAGPVEMIKSFAHLGAYFSFNIHLLARTGRAGPSAVATALADQPGEPAATPGSSAAARPAPLEAWKQLPADRLLVETDAPTKAPPPDRNRFPLGKGSDDTAINHPGNIAVAYASLAEMRGLPLETLASQVEANFLRLFG